MQRSPFAEKRCPRSRDTKPEFLPTHKTAAVLFEGRGARHPILADGGRTGYASASRCASHHALEQCILLIGSCPWPQRRSQGARVAHGCWDRRCRRPARLAHCGSAEFLGAGVVLDRRSITAPSYVPVLHSLWGHCSGARRSTSPFPQWAEISWPPCALPRDDSLRPSATAPRSDHTLAWVYLTACAPRREMPLRAM